MAQIKRKNSDWEKLSTRLIKEIQSIFIALMHFTEAPEKETKEKLYDIQKLINSKISMGLFSGTNFLSIDINDETSIKNIINQLFTKLKKSSTENN